MATSVIKYLLGQHRAVPVKYETIFLNKVQCQIPVDRTNLKFVINLFFQSEVVVIVAALRFVIMFKKM